MSTSLKKHIPLVLVGVGAVATLLPFVHVKVAEGSSLSGAVPTGAQNAWSAGAAGAILALLLGVSALFALAIEIWRARRLFLVPMTLVAGFASFISYFIARGVFGAGKIEGTKVVFSPGVGFIAMMAVFAGLIAIGIWGTVRPDPAGAS